MPTSQATSEQIVVPIKSRHLAIRCDADLLATLGVIARDRHAPVSAVIREAIRDFCAGSPKVSAAEGIVLTAALVEAIGDDGVRERFLRYLKLGDELSVRTGTKPSHAVAAITTALTAGGQHDYEAA